MELVIEEPEPQRGAGLEGFDALPVGPFFMSNYDRTVFFKDCGGNVFWFFLDGESFEYTEANTMRDLHLHGQEFTALEFVSLTVREKL